MNRLLNGGLAEGMAPWQWEVKRGRPMWQWQPGAVRIVQDGVGGHGEFFQVVPAKAQVRYRLSARIKTALEGWGAQSGANLYLVALRGNEVIGDLYFRPFFQGRSDFVDYWRVWSADYLTPAGTEALRVSFDMRNAGGVAWFRELCLCEVPEPLTRDTPLALAVEAHDAPYPPVATWTAQGNSSYMVDALWPLMGHHSRQYPVVDWSADALLVDRSQHPGLKDFANLARLGEEKVVLLTPRALADRVDAGPARLAEVSDEFQPPCLRIEREHFITRGFAAGDVIPWWHDQMRSGQFHQTQLRIDERVLGALGFEVLGRSVSAKKEGTGWPLLLYRPGKRGGMVVMDLELLSGRPGYGGEANLAALVLCNALGRPQTSAGRFVHPGGPLFSFGHFERNLRGIVQAHPSIKLTALAQSPGGRPVYALEIASHEAPEAPIFYVDAGIHADEWAPVYGTLLFAEKLARGYEQGRPWAQQLLKAARFVGVPLVCPDGFENHVRYVRGLDFNRNFPVHWEQAAGKTKGAHPLSEPETHAVAELLRTRPVKAAAFFHETTANTHWIGMPRTDGRYARYATGAAQFFREQIDSRHFAWQSATWTQISDERNFHWHWMDSAPFVRDYSGEPGPFAMFYADSLGIDAFTIEQYGNSDLSSSLSPARTEVTMRIIRWLYEMQYAKR